jgi:hypothetical protein
MRINAPQGSNTKEETDPNKNAETFEDYQKAA